MNSIKETALRMVKKGKSFIPVDRETKKPIIPWREYQSRLPSSEEAEAWFTPDNINIGLITGRLSGYVVIDCDSKEAIESFLQRYPDGNNTLQVQTGRGRHFYFQYEEGIRNDTGTILGPEIDIRGEGGFVVVPPSRHTNGTQYKRINSNNAARLSDKLKEVLVSRSPIKTEPGDGDKPASGVDRITEGRRNSFLTSMAGVMRRQGLSQETILNSLKKLNGESCEPPLPDDEVQRISKSVGSYEPAESIDTEQKSADNPWELALDVPSFLSQQDKEFKGLVKDLLAPGSITQISSPRGLGKTMVSYALAVALANGGNFRGEQIDPPRRVLLLDRDNPAKVIKERLRFWTKSKFARDEGQPKISLSCTSSGSLSPHILSRFRQFLPPNLFARGNKACCITTLVDNVFPVSPFPSTSGV